MFCGLLGRQQWRVRRIVADLGARWPFCGIDGKFRILPE
jgi:hypothetical protein